MNHRDKIKEPQELSEIVEDLKKQGKKIVHCHGCFDILHPGHLRYLEFAKNQGDILIVSLSGDKFIGKGIKTPFATSKLRAESLASVMFVDYITIDENPDAVSLINLIKPNIYIKGKEYAYEKKEHPGFLREKNTIESHGGKVIYSLGDIVFSSTKIINESLEREDMLVERCRSYLLKHNIGLNEIKKTIENFKNTNVLVIGDVFFKDYLLCNNPSISRDSPNLDLEVIGEERILGGAGLAAKFLAELEANVTLIAPNSEKNLLIEELRDNPKIDLKLFEFSKIPVKRRILSGENAILDLKFENNFILDALTEQKIIDSIFEKTKNSHGILLCDFGFGFLTERIIDEVILISKQKNIPVTLLIGTNSGRNLHKYRELNFVTLKEDDARNLVNDFNTGFDFLSKQIFSRTQYKNLIIDLESEGFICYRPSLDLEETAGNYASYLPLFSSKHKNFTEWKDMFRILIALSRFSGASIYISLYIGNLISLIKLHSLNKVSISTSDLLSVLETRRELF